MQAISSAVIRTTTEFLEAFFRNLILSEHNELRNRAMLVSDTASLPTPSPEFSPKCNFCTLDCTLEELALLNSRQSVGPVPD